VPGSSDMLRRPPAQEQDEEHPARRGDHDEARPAQDREDLHLVPRRLGEVALVE